MTWILKTLHFLVNRWDLAANKHNIYLGSKTLTQVYWENGAHF